MPTIRPPAGHVVIASADSDSYRSLRRDPCLALSSSNLAEVFVSKCRAVQWVPEGTVKSPGPIELIKQAHEGRLDWLIPIRVGA